MLLFAGNLPSWGVRAPQLSACMHSFRMVFVSWLLYKYLCMHACINTCMHACSDRGCFGALSVQTKQGKCHEFVKKSKVAFPPDIENADFDEDEHEGKLAESFVVFFSCSFSLIFHFIFHFFNFLFGLFPFSIFVYFAAHSLFLFVLYNR